MRTRHTYRYSYPNSTLIYNFNLGFRSCFENLFFLRTTAAEVTSTSVVRLTHLTAYYAGRSDLASGTWSLSVVRGCCVRFPTSGDRTELRHEGSYSSWTGLTQPVAYRYLRISPTLRKFIYRPLKWGISLNP
jgi:hypothetical protein